jgi:FkbM family methyltransferase
MKNDFICYLTRFGKLIHVCQDTVIGGCLKLYGEWAPGETALFKQILNPGGWVLDVGANIGFHSLFFSQQVAEQGRVLAFEPEKTNHHLLQLNALLNKLDNVHIYHALVGEKTTVNLAWQVQTNLQNRGDSRFSLTEDNPNLNNTDPLMQIALDDLRLTRCDLIKIDVQYYEHKVFKGAMQLLQTQRPVVFYEQDNALNYNEIKTLFEQLDYQCYWYVSKMFPKFNMNAASDDIYDGEAERNILAVPKEKPAQFDFLSTLIKVTGEQYNPPPLSQLGDDYAIKSTSVTETDEHWVNVLNEFLTAT